MKQRIITGAVIVAVMVAVLCLMYSPVFMFFFSLISAIAVYEIDKVAQIKNKVTIALSMLVAFFVPIYIEMDFKKVVSAGVLLAIYVLIMLFVMLWKYEKTRFEHIAISVFASIMVPCSFSVFLFLRDLYLIYPEKYSRLNGIYYIVFVFICSWITDTFAYFVGRKFGKHKLTPRISPKKTVEGALGGIIITAVVNLIVLYAFNNYLFISFKISYGFTLLLSVILSVVSMLGDLSASTIKRNYSIKDFGNLMPGHGGIMDRFDSCLFVLPSMYILLNLFTK
ncbi:MAG: phosphatidate cytidylyltransferase [Clostridiales bacterium]|nr:phosphatidate cytidylyltransferase [Clostridiales bacterium]